MSYEIRTGDVLEALKNEPDCSFDALLCDPPYGLRFMGKKWDYDVPSVAIWAECLRVLKPGAALLAFGGSRTFHRMTVAIEDAGFEIRDCLTWLYGAGFPKSLNVSKALYKAAGAERPVTGTASNRGNTKSKPALRDFAGSWDITAPSTDLAQRWDGYGTALKPAWEPIILARKPLDGTVAENVTQWGCGALDIDACRVGASGGTTKMLDAPVVRTSNNTVAMGLRECENADAGGRWPANLLFSHHEDCRDTGRTREVRNGTAVKRNGVTNAGALDGMRGLGTLPPGTPDAGYGVQAVGVWECHDGCPIRQLDEQAGDRPSTLTGRASPKGRHANPCDKRRSLGYNGGASSFGGGNSAVYADAGGPSRFFYSAKVSTPERNAGCEHLPKATQTTAHNGHPTLKPLGLTSYLAKLVKPPTSATRLLVPFAGAGSEMIGALQAGWPHVLGIEREPEYVTIAHARIKAWAPQD